VHQTAEITCEKFKCKLTAIGECLTCDKNFCSTHFDHDKHKTINIENNHNNYSDNNNSSSDNSQDKKSVDSNTKNNNINNNNNNNFSDNSSIDSYSNNNKINKKTENSCALTDLLKKSLKQDKIDNQSNNIYQTPTSNKQKQTKIQCNVLYCTNDASITCKKDCKLMFCEDHKSHDSHKIYQCYHCAKLLKKIENVFCSSCKHNFCKDHEKHMDHSKLVLCGVKSCRDEKLNNEFKMCQYVLCERLGHVFCDKHVEHEKHSNIDLCKLFPCQVFSCDYIGPIDALYTCLDPDGCAEHFSFCIKHKDHMHHTALKLPIKCMVEGCDDTTYTGKYLKHCIAEGCDKRKNFCKQEHLSHISHENKTTLNNIAECSRRGCKEFFVLDNGYRCTACDDNKKIYCISHSDHDYFHKAIVSEDEAKLTICFVQGCENSFVANTGNKITLHSCKTPPCKQDGSKLFCEEHVNEHNETHQNDYTKKKALSKSFLEHVCDSIEKIEIEEMTFSGSVDEDTIQNGMFLKELKENKISNFEESGVFKAFALFVVEYERQRMELNDDIRMSFYSMLKNNIKIIIPEDDSDISSKFCVVTLFTKIFTEIENQKKIVKENHDYLNTTWSKTEYEENIYNAKDIIIDEFIKVCYAHHSNNNLYCYNNPDFELKDAFLTDGIVNYKISESFDVEMDEGETIKKRYIPALMYLTSSAGFESILKLNFMLYISTQKKTKRKPLTYVYEGKNLCNFKACFLHRIFGLRVDSEHNLLNVPDFDSKKIDPILTDYPVYKAVLELCNYSTREVNKVSTNERRYDKFVPDDDVIKNDKKIKDFTKDINKGEKKSLKDLASTGGIKRWFIDNMDEQSTEIFKSDKKIKKFDDEITKLETVKIKRFPLKPSTSATPSTLTTTPSTITKPKLTSEEKKISSRLTNSHEFEKKIEKVKAKRTLYENAMIENFAVKNGVKTMLKPVHDVAVKQMETLKPLKDKGIKKVVVINKVEFNKIIKDFSSPKKGN